MTRDRPKNLFPRRDHRISIRISEAVELHLLCVGRERVQPRATKLDHDVVVLVGVPAARWVSLLLAVLRGSEEGAVGSEDDIPPFIPAPARVLEPGEGAADRAAAGARVQAQPLAIDDAIPEMGRRSGDALASAGRTSAHLFRQAGKSDVQRLRCAGQQALGAPVLIPSVGPHRLRRAAAASLCCGLGARQQE